MCTTPECGRMTITVRFGTCNSRFKFNTRRRTSLECLHAKQLAKRMTSQVISATQWGTSRSTMSPTWTRCGRAAPTWQTRGSTICAFGRRRCRCATTTSITGTFSVVCRRLISRQIHAPSYNSCRGFTGLDLPRHQCQASLLSAAVPQVACRVMQDAYADRRREAQQTPALKLTLVGPPMSSPNYINTLGQVRFSFVN